MRTLVASIIFICKHLFLNWLKKAKKCFSQGKAAKAGIEPGMSHIPRRSAVHWTMTETCGTAFPGSSPAVQIWSLFRLRFDGWRWETCRQTREMGFPIPMWERLEEKPLWESRTLRRVRSTFKLEKCNRRSKSCSVQQESAKNQGQNIENRRLYRHSLNCRFFKLNETGKEKMTGECLKILKLPYGKLSIRFTWNISSP
jgi:hypothetical protein